ncbi:MAG: hypothetical protein IPJ69_02255 [Deltaproteobacteria bacterium]|nr:MAG: hypothetical protein IPJ69_02255 [Deltaproteobacteria bacterium]
MTVTRLTDIAVQSSLWGPLNPSQQSFQPPPAHPETLHATRSDDVGLGTAGRITVTPNPFALARFFNPGSPSAPQLPATLKYLPPLLWEQDPLLQRLTLH